MTPTIAILISGRGSNMEALAAAAAEGRLQARVACVVSNRADAAGLDIAQRFDIATHVVPHKGLTRDEHGQILRDTLAPYDVNLVCLAGFMRLLSAGFTETFRHRVVNIHPSLLPAFPGLNAQGQAIEYGVKVSGCTVHLVDEHLDHGPIVAQHAVPVFENDTEETLSARILAEEHRLYPTAVQRLLHDKWNIIGRRIVFDA